MLNLPHTTIVGKVVPKNSFDKFTNSRQKKLMTECVERIRWTNKLSPDTIRLEGSEIIEIQVFEIALRKKTNTSEILDVIDRNIPYHIVFELHFENEVQYSAAQKHQHPTAEASAVIDWRFLSEWKKMEDSGFQLNLKISLDEVFTDFCLQVAGKDRKQKHNLTQVIQTEAIKKRLNTEIEKLESEIKSCKQFNKKVELNVKLHGKKGELENY